MLEVITLLLIIASLVLSMIQYGAGRDHEGSIMLIIAGNFLAWFFIFSLIGWV